MGEKLFSIKHDCYELKSHDKKDVREYRLVGPLCSSDDIIIHSFVTGKLKIGDILLIDGVGAYDFSTAYQFSREFPLIYVIPKNGQIKIYREN